MGEAMLILAALVWIGAHVGVAGSGMRDTLVSRVGENGFRIRFSLISIAALAFLIVSYIRADTTPLWSAADWLRWLLVLAMLPAFMLFVGSLTTPNPTMLGGERGAARGVGGVQRITRHPMLWSFAIWAAVHVIGNGDTASIVFFGAFLITALAGMPSIDGKLKRRDPVRWEGIARETSILPFAAIAGGRNKLVPGEIGWPVWAGGTAAWVVLLALHHPLFGVTPVPV
jgi:uncharacterized membrane protein